MFVETAVITNYCVTDREEPNDTCGWVLMQQRVGIGAFKIGVVYGYFASSDAVDQ